MASHYSDDAFSFVGGCLRHLPSERLTASQAYEHPWLQDSQLGCGDFKRLEEEANQAWKPRTIILPPLVRLGQSSGKLTSSRTSTPPTAPINLLASPSILQPATSAVKSRHFASKQKRKEREAPHTPNPKPKKKKINVEDQPPKWLQISSPSQQNARVAS